MFTEATLLSAMENAGREIEDGEVRKAMDGCGIGTPATRANIIETLLLREYIRREKKTLVPTDKVWQSMILLRISESPMLK